MRNYSAIMPILLKQKVNQTNAGYSPSEIGSRRIRTIW